MTFYALRYGLRVDNKIVVVTGGTIGIKLAILYFISIIFINKIDIFKLQIINVE